MKALKSKKVVVGLSGGVDSSVAAYLLKKQGYDVTGVYIQCWDAKADGCTANEDRADAVKVAAHLNIPFEHLHFEKEYKERVIGYFYKEYEAGRTPNPDVMCNKEIKFGMFMEWALNSGFDFVATGHYARVRRCHCEPTAKQSRRDRHGAVASRDDIVLLKGADSSKDQSYFLYLLTPSQLEKTLFPLGEMKKGEVRKIAKEQGLHTFDKPDSVGICFIGEVDIKEFLKKRIKENPGEVVDKTGEVIGSHDGIAFYTIGQRHGFKVNKYHGLPLYVIGKNVEKNELIVGFGKDGLVESFDVSELHWINGAPEFPLKCDVRIRHLGELYPITFDGAKVRLKDSIFGVAPGQSVVLYDGDIVLGGGVIS